MHVAPWTAAWVLGVLVIAARPLATAPPAAPPLPTILQGGEELVYEATWSFIKIGTVRLKLLPPAAGALHHADAFVDSYDGLPFVDLHAVVTSEMDTAYLSHGARTFRKKDNRWRGLEYHIDRNAGFAFIDDIEQQDPAGEPTRRTRRDTLSIRGLEGLQDGLSILYYARAHARRPQSKTIPVISYGHLGSVQFIFGTAREDVDVAALPRPVRTVCFEGSLHTRGVFGLTGDFRGWVSDDSAAVPIKAELQVILGSVKLELREWKRSGWVPPH